MLSFGDDVGRSRATHICAPTRYAPLPWRSSNLLRAGDCTGGGDGHSPARELAYLTVHGAPPAGLRPRARRSRCRSYARARRGSDAAFWPYALRTEHAWLYAVSVEQRAVWPPSSNLDRVRLGLVVCDVSLSDIAIPAVSCGNLSGALPVHQNAVISLLAAPDRFPIQIPLLADSRL